MSEATKNIWRGVALLAVCIAIAGWVGWLSAKNLLFDSAVAAWVQAVGSVVAILAATAVASRQGREAESREARTLALAARGDRQRRIDLLQGALGVANVAQGRMKFLREIANDTEKRENLRPVDNWIALLTNADASLETFPLASLGDAQVIQALSEMRTQLHFSRSAMRNLGAHEKPDEALWGAIVVGLDQSTTAGNQWVQVIQRAIDALGKTEG